MQGFCVAIFREVKVFPCNSGHTEGSPTLPVLPPCHPRPSLTYLARGHPQVAAAPIH